jgi:hypothetical protein
MTSATAATANSAARKASNAHVCRPAGSASLILNAIAAPS